MHITVIVHVCVSRTVELYLIVCTSRKGIILRRSWVIII